MAEQLRHQFSYGVLYGGEYLENEDCSRRERGVGMRKERKVNTIRALRYELDFYKRQPVPVKIVDRTELIHLRLHQMFSREEVMQMPKEMVSPLLQHRMVKAFENAIMELPIETEFDEHFGVYRASLDLWVKPKRF